MVPKRYTLATSTAWTSLGERLASVDSTSRLLQSRVQDAIRARAVLPQGTSLRADFQTHGRGRLGRRWEGAAGENLYVSYLLDAAGLKAGRLFTLSQNIALVVRDVVEDFAGPVECRVKWPNDVFVGRAKVAGLLVEASLAAEDPLYVVVGIGLNVNQIDFAEAPGATSLRKVTNQAFDLDEVWAALTRRLQVAHAELRAAVSTGDVYAISHRYHEHLLGFGQWGRYRRSADDSCFAARLQGVNSHGQLILELGGAEERFSLDEIRYEGPVVAL